MTPKPTSDQQSSDESELSAVKAITGPAAVMRNAGQTRNAASLLLQGLRDHKDNPRILCSLAEVRRREGNSADARKIFLQVIESNPDNVVARTSLAQMELDLGKQGKAAKQFLAALEIDPRFARAIGGLMDIAKIYLQKQLYEQAEQLLEKVLEADPDNKYAKAQLGKVKIELGDFDGAQKLAKSILAMEDMDKFGFNLMGQACLGTKDYFNAKEWFDRTLEIDPDNPIARTGMAEALMEEGDLDEAEKFLQAVVSHDYRNMFAADLLQELNARRMEQIKPDSREEEEAA